MGPHEVWPGPTEETIGVGCTYGEYGSTIRGCTTDGETRSGIPDTLDGRVRCLLLRIGVSTLYSTLVIPPLNLDPDRREGWYDPSDCQCPS